MSPREAVSDVKPPPAPPSSPAPEAPVGANPVRFRRLRTSRWTNRVVTLALAALLLVFWYVATARDWVSSIIIPSPQNVVRALDAGFVSEGLWWQHLWSTLQATVVGFLISSALAIVIAALLSSSARLEQIILPFIIAFQTLPKVAIAPLILLWLGFGQTSKLTIVVVVCFFPVLVNALQGLRIRHLEQYELLKSVGASKWKIIWYLRVPYALPYVFAGLQIAIIFALIGAIVAEFVGNSAGLGYVLIQQKAVFNVSGVFAILFVLMVIGMTLHGIMRWIEVRMLFWASDVTARN